MTEVEPFGPLDAEVAVIGEAPGYQEMSRGRPFVGPSGDLLRSTLTEMGVDPERIRYLNVYPWYREGNPTPKVKEINAQRGYINQQLAQLPNLRAVLLVGNVPLTAISGKGGVTKRRGSVQEFHKDIEVPGRVAFFTTLHPAAVLRNQNYSHGWRNDLAGFALLVHPHEDQDIIERVFERDVTAFMLASRDATEGSIDIETTVDKEGERFRGGVTMVSAAVTFNGTTAFTFAFTDHHEGDWNIQAWVDLMAQATPNVRWIMQNGYFDRGRLRLLGWDPELAHDTMAIAYLLNPDERKGLEYLSAVHLQEPPYKGVDYHKVMEEPIGKILEMNGRDALRTWRLRRVLGDKINAKPELLRLYKFVLMPAVNALIEITEEGLPMDVARLEAKTLEVEAGMAELETEQARLAGRDLNPRSPLQLQKLWFEEWELPVLITTDKGLPSTSKQVRKLLLFRAKLTDDQRAHIEAVDEYKTLQQRYGYLKSWAQHLDQDGLLHPTYKPLHVVTGRLSSSDPNVQQVPREKEYRALFGGVPGWSWVKVDYSQIELRIAAWVSRDPRLLEAYRMGMDIHLVNGLRIMEEPHANIQKANLLLLRSGLPANRAGAEILHRLWDTAPEGAEPYGLLQVGSQEQDQDTRSGEGGVSTHRAGSSFLEEWYRNLQNPPEELLRVVREYKALGGAPSEPRSVEQRSLQPEDAVQILSRQGAQVALELWPELKEIRQKAKPVGFGLLYGAWWKKLQEIAFFDYGVTFTDTEAERHWNRYFETYAGLSRWHDSMKREMHRTGASRSALGRVRYLPDLYSPDRGLQMAAEREGINHPIQSMASDLTLIAVGRLQEALDPEQARIITTVHDEINFLVRNESVTEVVAEVVDIMENPPLKRWFGIDLDVPLVAEADVSTHWSGE